MSITIALYARRKQWPLTNVEIRLRFFRSHMKDCEHCMDKDALLDRIDTEVKLEGALTAEQRARLLEIGQRCPVHHTLKTGIHVTAVGA
ncbi:MAG TPA: OsmC family protein [Gemmatimonadales bacterium]|nr:OsmC family protein [Gemmatimonadales bacterium]